MAMGDEYQAQRLRHAILSLTMLLGFQLLFTGGKAMFGASQAAKAVTSPANTGSAIH